MRTCKTWALPAVLALTLAAPAAASEVTPARGNDVTLQLQLIANELQALHREIEVLRQDLRDLAVRGAVTTVDVRSLKDRLDSIDTRIGRQDRAIVERGAFSPAPVPVPVPAPAPPPATGTIVLRNFSRVGGAFTVNGTRYTVMPGASAVIERMPTGSFTYEIEADGFGLLRGPTSRTLTTGQTYYLNIDPQP
jgi:hypothetical protein